MIISKNIRALRSAYNLTQRELAEIASVTENAVSKWENGYAAPRLGAVEKITSHFGLSTSALLESFEIQNGGGGSDPSRSSKETLSSSNLAYIPFRQSGLSGLKAIDQTETEPCNKVPVPSFLVECFPDCFVLKNDSDDMDRSIPRDCLIVVTPDTKPENGSIVLVSIDQGPLLIRRLLRTNQTIVLSAESSALKCNDLVFPTDSHKKISFVGRIIWFQPERIL